MAPANTVRRGFFMALKREEDYIITTGGNILHDGSDEKGFVSQL